MANNKNNESIDEKAYEALENALQINFRDDKSSPRQKAQPDAKGAVNKPRQRSEQAQPRRAPDAAGHLHALLPNMGVIPARQTGGQRPFT